MLPRSSSHGNERTQADFPSLCCPECHTKLHAEKGRLHCPACPATYPVVDGVPRFTEQSYAASFGTEWTTFRKTQLDSANGTRISRRRFEQLSPIPIESLRGKRVLEAGCGMGRFLEVLAEEGATVVGADMSEAVESSNENVGHRDNVRIVQANLFELPFEKESFDYVYTFGVIHHTPDPRAAVARLASLVRAGGHLTVWVYGRRGPAWIPRPHRVYAKGFQRLPEPALLPALKLYAKAALPLGRLPIAGRVLRQIFPVQDLTLKGPNQDGYETAESRALDPDFVLEWAWLNSFDAFTPRYATQHVYEEVEEWLRAAGLENLQRTGVRSSVTGQKPFAS